MTATKYTDPEMEAERVLGYNDVMAGHRKGRPGLKHVSAYTTGQAEAYEALDDRKKKAQRERLAALREARRTA